MTLLCELAKKYETDKGGAHYRYGGGDSDTCHAYTQVYHSLFGERRNEVRHVFEIGINAGSSLRMWKEYFPNADIVGIDSDERCLVHDEDRIKCYGADQNNPAHLYAVMEKLKDKPPFDLIVDDGSHNREHQVASLKALLPFLAPWGYYVIEDLGAGPQDLSALWRAVPSGYVAAVRKIEGGLGHKVQPYEWLFIVRRDDPVQE